MNQRLFNFESIEYRFDDLVKKSVPCKTECTVVVLIILCAQMKEHKLYYASHPRMNKIGMCKIEDLRTPEVIKS